MLALCSFLRMGGLPLVFVLGLSGRTSLPKWLWQRGESEIGWITSVISAWKLQVPALNKLFQTLVFSQILCTAGIAVVLLEMRQMPIRAPD